MNKFIEINFSPYFHNVLDYVGKDDLITKSGEKVEIRRSGYNGEFVIIIGGVEVSRTPDNLHASFILNTNCVGYIP